MPRGDGDWVGDVLGDETALRSGVVAKLRAREAALLKRRAVWLKPLEPYSYTQGRMERGFVSHVAWAAARPAGDVSAVAA